MSILYEEKGSDITAAIADGLSFILHYHSHIELVYMLKGKSRAFSDYKEVYLEEGDLFITFPNQIHCYSDNEPVQCILLIFPQDLCSDYFSLFHSYVPEEPVVRKNQCPENTISILQAIVDSNCSDSPFHTAISKGYFAVLLGELFEIMSLKKVESNDLDTVRCILNYCTKNYQNEISLETLSNTLGINKFHISHLFSQKLKIGFIDFVNSLRVDDACNRLKSSNDNITEIAFQAGFSSIRSFNRVFQKQTGVTPSEYRNKQLV